MFGRPTRTQVPCAGAEVGGVLSSDCIDISRASVFQLDAPERHADGRCAYYFQSGAGTAHHLG